MARSNKTSEKAKENNYKEYDITAANANDFKGRVYTEAKAHEKGKTYGITITINGISIRGCKLWVPKDENKDCSILFPTFEKEKDGKKEYTSYITFFEEKDRADVTELANKLAELVD